MKQDPRPPSKRAAVQAGGNSIKNKKIDVADTFNLFLTGIPEKASLVGCQKQTEGVRMDIDFSSVFDEETNMKLVFPPQLSQEDMMDINPENPFLGLLNDGIFANKTAEEKKLVLSSANCPPDEKNVQYFSDGLYNRATVLVTDLGKSTNDFHALCEEFKEQILSGPMTLWELHSLINFEKLDDSKGPGDTSRHNLVFRPDNWRLDYKINMPLSDCQVFDLDTLEFLAPDDDSVVNPSDTKSKFITNFRFGKSDKPLAVAYTFGRGVFKKFPGQIGAPDELAWYGCGMKKSALQKAIRFAGKTVEFRDGLTIQNSDYISIIGRLLVTDPGSLIPDLQIFVKGSESYFKRLAVIIVEDASLDPVSEYSVGSKTVEVTDAQRITALLVVAAACRFGFEVPEYFFQNTLDWAMEASTRKEFYEYETSHYPDKLTLHMSTTQRLYSMSSNNEGSSKEGFLGKGFHYASDLLESLKAFKSDLIMFKWVEVNYGRQNSSKKLLSETQRPDKMMSFQAVDHHAVTDIVHFIPGEQSFEKKLEYLWSYGSCLNYRKHGNRRIIPKAILQAQESYTTFRMMCKGLLYKAETTATLSGEHKPEQTMDLVEVKVPLGWLSFAMSTTCIKDLPNNHPKMLAFLDPIMPDTIRAIRPPSKDEKKKAPVSPEAVAEAKNKFLQLLEKGVSIQCPFDTNRSLQVSWDYDIGLLVDSKPYETWSEQCCQARMGLMLSNHELTSLKGNVVDLVSLLVARLDKCERYDVVYLWRFHLSHQLSLCSQNTKKRLLFYFQPVQDAYHLLKVSRDGKGSDLPVMPEDTEVAKIFLLLRLICPGFVDIKGNFVLLVKNRLGFLSIRDWILKSCEDAKSTVDPAFFRDLTWSYPFQMKNHQQEAIRGIENKRETGQKGHLLWMDMGQGKTVIALKLIYDMMRGGEFPGYCIYTYPASAKASLEKELQSSGLPFQFHTPQKRNGKTNGSQSFFLKRKVICVDHDHLRKMPELLDIAPNSLFVVDEVHLLMNETQRTSMGLQIATLCSDFLGMTGTLIYDKNIQKTTRWLQKVVSFPVNKKSFIVASGSVLSFKSDIGVAVHYNDVEVKMEREDFLEYSKYVPERMGGVAVNVDYHEAAMISYNVVENAIYQRLLQRKQECPGDDIFCVVKDRNTGERLSAKLTERGYRCFLFGKGDSLDYRPETNERYDVVFAPISQSTGYTLTKINFMITSVYPSNQASREQIQARLVRWGQKRDVYIETIHTGILTYTLNHHESASSLSKTLKQLAKEAEF